MAIYLDQAISGNATRGEFGYDWVQWVPWNDAEVYCAQFIKNGKRYGGCSRIPYKNWSPRSTHIRDGGRCIKVIGCLADVALRGKGPVAVEMETNDRLVVELGAAIVDAERRPRSRRRVRHRDVSSNAMR